METTVLCLANSKKEGERCIAGIDVRTGQWVRPVSRHTPKGEVPFHERQVEGGEPRLLDLIRMDLAHDGPAGFDYCHSKENRWIDPSPWTREGVATAGDLHHYICRGELILHTRGKYTHPALIEAKPLSERTTLELYEVTLLSCEKAGGKWKASLTTTEGITLQDISVTDCTLVERLNAEEVIEKNGYAIISLSLPWTPPIEGWSEGAVGWKLLAGWIPAVEANVDVHASHGTAASRTSADKDEPLLTGYYLQTTPEGGRWRLYDIREQDECRICEINAFDNRLEMQRLSGPYDAIIEHWNAGVQEQLICTNRIIELLWQQQAPQAISDQLAAWHREDEARDFAALQSQRPQPKPSDFAYRTKQDIVRCTGASDAAVRLAVDQLRCREPFSLVEADRLAFILTGDPSIRRAYNREHGLFTPSTHQPRFSTNAQNQPRTGGFDYASRADICRCTGKSEAEVQRAIDALRCSEPFDLVAADRLAAILTGDPSIKRAFNRTALRERRIDRRDSIPVADGANAGAEHLPGGLEEFYAEEAEMERQLGGEAKELRLEQWEVPDEKPDPEEENLELEVQGWLDDHYTRGNPYTEADEERDFREWMDALNEQRDGAVDLSAEERLHGGLEDFYAQEAEMECQLGGEPEVLWLDQWEVPDEPPDPEEQNLELETQRWLEDHYARWNASRGVELQPSGARDYDAHEEEDDRSDYSDEVEPETPSYREWDDMDNFWNQEGVFEEMSDLYPLDEDY